MPAAPLAKKKEKKKGDQIKTTCSMLPEIEESGATTVLLSPHEARQEPQNVRQKHCHSLKGNKTFTLHTKKLTC